METELTRIVFISRLFRYRFPFICYQSIQLHFMDSFLMHLSYIRKFGSSSIDKLKKCHIIFLFVSINDFGP